MSILVSELVQYLLNDFSHIVTVYPCQNYLEEENYAVKNEL